MKRLLPAAGLLAALGLFGPPATAQTSEDGIAIVKAQATAHNNGKLRVRVECVDTGTETNCSGTFRLASKRAGWTIARGSFAEIPSGRTEALTLALTAKGRAEARAKCKFKATAIVTPAAPLSPNSIADVDQRTITISRDWNRC